MLFAKFPCWEECEAALANFFCLTNSAVMYSGSEGICLVLFSITLLIFEVIFKYSGDALVVEIGTYAETALCPLEVPLNVKWNIL